MTDQIMTESPGLSWYVKRHDDHGNSFLIESGLTKYQASRLFADLTSRGHKQWYEIGNHYFEKFEKQLIDFQDQIKARPDDPLLYNYLGNAYNELGRYEEAIEQFKKVIEIEPRYIQIYYNVGVSLYKMNRHEEALQYYRKTIERDPNFVSAHFNSGISFLALGKYEEGWDELEWQWKLPSTGYQNFIQPQWSGELIKDKNLLLYSVGGFGDTLQFCRYIPLIDSNIILGTLPDLTRLLSYNFPEIEIKHFGEPLPVFDFHCPLMSLPRAFKTRIDTIPNLPYLKADLFDIEKWRVRLEKLSGLKIGLVWSGDPRKHDLQSNEADSRRSLNLDYFADFSNFAGVHFISLQKGEASSQTRAPPKGMIIYDWTDELVDFADTAALVSNLDLVISVDTSMVHLVGALGKPVWLLNRFDTCWRWLLERSDSPWYPTMKIFRQPTHGDWDSVMKRVVEELRKWVNLR